jgi:hypothetical protein
MKNLFLLIAVILVVTALAEVEPKPSVVVQSDPHHWGGRYVASVTCPVGYRIEIYGLVYSSADFNLALKEHRDYMVAPGAYVDDGKADDVVAKGTTVRLICGPK